MNENMDSKDMNDGTANGGLTEGASSDGDLDFQGQADHTGDTCCGCSCGTTKTSGDLSNDFPKSQEPSGDGTGIKAGGAQAE